MRILLTRLLLKDVYDHILMTSSFSRWDGMTISAHRSSVKCLDKHRLKVKEAKCEFGWKFVEYLGHIVGDGKLAVPEHRAAAMKEFKQPRTKKELRSFLGAMLYYRCFILHFADYSVLRKNGLIAGLAKIDFFPRNGIY